MKQRRLDPSRKCKTKRTPLWSPFANKYKVNQTIVEHGYRWRVISVKESFGFQAVKFERTTNFGEN